VKGDLSEVFRTQVLREFPFPQIEGERFCPEALVWNRIAQQYKLLYFNQPIYIAEYQSTGLSAKIVKIRMQSPQASMLTYSELASYNIPALEKLKAILNFWRFSWNSKAPLAAKRRMISSWFSVIAGPLGYILYLNDRRKQR